jgi:hypothetical protein
VSFRQAVGSALVVAGVTYLSIQPDPARILPAG